MISAHHASPPLVTDNQFVDSEEIASLQKMIAGNNKATALITNSEGIPLTKPHFAYPFINPDTGEGKLWHCCLKTIRELSETVHDNDGLLMKICDCKHDIAVAEIRLLNDDVKHQVLIKLTTKNNAEQKILARAVENGFTVTQALNAYKQTDIGDYDRFTEFCKLMQQQSLLFHKLLKHSAYVQKIDAEEVRSIHEEALIRAKNEAEESSRLKSSLLANMSHELRTPMTGILGFSEILHDELEDDRLKNMASTIFKSANRLMTTLNSIMDLSAIESNRTNLQLKSVNVKTCFMSLLRSAYNAANDKGLYIRTALPPNINVIADDKLLGQLLHHLLDNAIKFTIDGGISISAYSGLKETSDVVIKISDTGIGIDPQHHRLIFEEFRQVSEGLSRTFEGSGLGLSLVMKIASLLNAKVWVESETDKGSDFFVSIPSAEQGSLDIIIPEEKPEPISTIRLGRGNVPEVLIVEDNEINRRLAALYLREICNIDMAENGYIALSKIKAKKYDAILMDINLGAGPNGIHIAQEIKSMDDYKDVPIIAVTGYTMQGDREKLLANGCSHYVAKPYDKKTLIKLFSGLLYKQTVTNHN